VVFWFWWAPISCVHVQRLEHVARWDLRIRLGRPSKSRLLLPLFGGLPCGLLKLFLLQVKASGEGLWVDCPFPEGCVSPVLFLLWESLSVVICVVFWLDELAEGGRTEGSSCLIGHVRSVCVWTARVAGSVGPLLEATTAAAVRFPWADLPSLSAVTILRASINDMFLSAFTCWTRFSNNHFGQFLLKAEWLPVQFGHLSSLVQSLLVWPIWPHVAQVSLPLQAFFPWPNFWHLKGHSGAD